MMDVAKLSGTYMRWMIRLGCFPYIIYWIACMAIKSFWNEDLAAQIKETADIPMAIACLFVIVTGFLFMLLWRMIAKNSPESLTTFYNASSGLRMLLALGVITTYYFVFGQEAITPMAIVFMVMYFLQLIVHSAFFTKYLK